MISKTSKRPITRCAVVVASAAAIGTVHLNLAADRLVTGGPPTVTILETFDEHMGPWTARGNIWCPGQGCSKFHWEITRSVEEVHAGEWALKVRGSGQWDNGTLRIERPVQLLPGQWDIDLSFFIHDDLGSIAGWVVTAYIDTQPPAEQDDFEWIGAIAHLGWKEFQYSRTLEVTEPTTAWVALGYRITWETCLTHYFDSVTISGIPPQPDHRPGDLNFDGVVGVADLLLLLENWGPCPHDGYECWCGLQDVCHLDSPDTDCYGDLTGSGAVGVGDLLLLLANWG